LRRRIYHKDGSPKTDMRVHIPLAGPPSSERGSAERPPR